MRTALPVCVAVSLAIGSGRAQISPNAHPDVRLFFEATAVDDAVADAALDQIGGAWRDGYAGILWDLARVMRPERPRPIAPPLDSQPNLDDPLNPPALPAPREPEHPTTAVRRRLVRFLERQTGQRFGDDLERWHKWIWDQPYDPHPDYAWFKGLWYAEIDPGFAEFFPRGTPAAIRLDEVDWGGVRVNGIPPLQYPKHLAAADATYLKDDHIIFGIAVNSEARAYPKRILAWHEMAIDRLGGVELTIVYCTLCGTVIPYESVVSGRHLTFGTSGLLYRSNKLMFDHDTKSLWNTFEGVPVVGPLVGSGLRLMPRSVVTTTWGEWRRRHPGTTVLSLETGHARDYSEGAAYRDYFATDRLMFPVSKVDDRLKNKDEVLVMLIDDPATPGARQPLAISARFLARNRVFHHVFAGRRLVVVTSEEGANRVYDAGDVRFVRPVAVDRITDTVGRNWLVTEDALVRDDGAASRPRVSAQRAFWFGWYAQFPATALVK